MMRLANYYGAKQVEDALAVFAKWMSGNSRLRVNYHNGHRVDCDRFAGVINIPRLACSGGLAEEDLMLIRGRVYHEGGHILKTTGVGKNEWPAGAVFECWNALEDRRMERCVGEDFPGAAKVFQINADYYNRKIAGDVADGKVDAPLWEALVAMSFQSEGVIPKWRLSPKAQAYFDAGYDIFTGWKSCQSAREALELAKRLHDALKLAHEEWKAQHQQPQPQPQPDQEQAEEAGEGEGEEGGEQGQSGEAGEGEGAEEGEGASGASGDAFDDEDNGKPNKPGKGSSDEQGQDDADTDDEAGKADDEGDEGEAGEDRDTEGTVEGTEKAEKGAEQAAEDEAEDEDGGKGAGADGEPEKGTEKGGQGTESGNIGGDYDTNYDTKDGRGSEEDGESTIEAMDREAKGKGLDEYQNEAIEAALDELPKVDCEYLSRRDLDEHMVVDGTDQDKAAYQQERRHISASVAIVVQAMEQALRARTRCRKLPFVRQGKIDNARLVQIAKGLSKEVMFQTRKGEEIDTAVEIVIDESGSMHAFHQVRLVAMALGEALSQLGIEFEVTGTTTKYGAGDWRMPELQGMNRSNPIIYRHYKMFGEQWARVCHRIVKSGAFVHNVDGEVVEHAARRLLARPEPRKIILSLSDGLPDAGHGNGNDMAMNLSRACERARKAGVEVYGFGVGTVAPARYYGKKFFVGLNVQDLGTTFAKQVSAIIGSGRLIGA